MSWLTGNAVIDWMAIAGTVFCLGVPAAFGLWILWDRIHPASGQHAAIHGDEEGVRAVVPAPSPEPEPAEPRSPFRRKREAK